MQRVLAPIPNMPSPILTFAGDELNPERVRLPSARFRTATWDRTTTSIRSNSSIKIFDKLGNALNGTNGTTYNSFFSALGAW